MTLRETLKTQTLDAHQSIEKSMPIASADFSKEEYRSLLQKFYGFHVPLERRFADFRAQHSGLFPDGDRSKVPALSSDLKDLGLDESDLSRLPLATDLPNVDDLRQITGVLYVIEGSTLGGQLIFRHLEEKFGSDIPRRYFGGYGPRTGPMWQSFIKWLEALPIEPQDHAITVEAANKTFRSLQTWLDS